MPLSKAIEIIVTGNVDDEYLKMRRERITYIDDSLHHKINVDNPVCPICLNKMDSPHGSYNGMSDVNDDGDCTKDWEFECENFHNASWLEILI